MTGASAVQVCVADGGCELEHGQCLCEGVIIVSVALLLAFKKSEEENNS